MFIFPAGSQFLNKSIQIRSRILYLHFQFRMVTLYTRRRCHSKLEDFIHLIAGELIGEVSEPCSPQIFPPLLWHRCKLSALNFEGFQIWRPNCIYEGVPKVLSSFTVFWLFNTWSFKKSESFLVPSMYIFVHVLQQIRAFKLRNKRSKAFNNALFLSVTMILSNSTCS